MNKITRFISNITMGLFRTIGVVITMLFLGIIFAAGSIMVWLLCVLSNESIDEVMDNYLCMIEDIFD